MAVHGEKGGLRRDGQGQDGQPVVVVAGDHHFPANIPARGEGECIKILRVENGSLAEITGELVRMSPRGGGGPGPGCYAWVLRDAGGRERGPLRG
jgi:hypothetical protein